MFVHRTLTLEMLPGLMNLDGERVRGRAKVGRGVRENIALWTSYLKAGVPPLSLDTKLYFKLSLLTQVLI